jgi:hypothetical protein
MYFLYKERLLRSNLLQPPNNIKLINDRLDIVHLFLSDSNLL